MKVYKANKKSKISTLAVCLLLTAILAIGGTLAYIFTSTPSVTNTFTPVTVENEIVETLNGNIKSNVKIKNTGTTDAFIRAKVVITWQNAKGDVYPARPVLDTASNDGDYSIDYNTAEWILGSDGFWYCKKDVAPNALSAILINEAEPLKICEDSAYTLHIEIISQAIQSTPDETVESVWTLVDAENGALKSVG